MEDARMSRMTKHELADVFNWWMDQPKLLSSHELDEIKMWWMWAAESEAVSVGKKRVEKLLRHIAALAKGERDHGKAEG
jgi:hypothetical protein